MSDDVAEARTWVEAQGLEFVRTFTDGPVSGRSVSNKAGFKAMMEMAAEGNFELLVIRDLAQIARNAVAVNQCVQQLEALGIAIWQFGIGEFVDLNAKIPLLLNEIWSETHGSLTGGGNKRLKATGKKRPLDVALATLARLDHPPGWDVVPHVRFSAAYKYDYLPKVKKYLVYGRDASNVRDGLALEEDQILRCHRLGQREGWRCAGTFGDLGVGDAGQIGPALTKLLDRIRLGDIAYVLVGDLSQLSRDPLVIAEITDTFAAAGTQLAVAHDHLERFR